MKILNVIANMDEETGGGSTERARQLSLHLSKIGHEVVILSTNYRLSSSVASSLGGVQLITLPCLNSRYLVPLPLLGKISRAVKEADVIHLFNHWTLINVMIFAFARVHKKPHVVNPLGSLCIVGRARLLKRMYNILFGKRIVQKASLCVVATRNEMPAFRSYGVDKSRIVHIPNGINEEDYRETGDPEFRSNIGVGEHPFILFVGRLNPIKGPDLLLQAFCRVKDRFPDIHLAYIGPDEGMQTSLRIIASEHSVLKRVHFLGFVSREDKSRLLHSMRFLVIPSRQEAMSIVVLEAGITGKPVVLTDQCGFDEVEEVGGGRVVPATVDGLTQGIEAMLSQKHDLELMGKNLQRLVRDKFLWSSIARRPIFSDKLDIDESVPPPHNCLF
jgi:glycosyltransferase involved in cell wall biosynthesis